jgi:hypothetical protein
MKSIMAQKDEKECGSQSVYLWGCRGMGKTCTLMLLGDSFVQMGCYSVYFFESVAYISQNNVLEIKKCLLDETKQVVVLVDEIDSNTNSHNLSLLLKLNNSRLTIVGAAVPSNVKSANTGNFRSKIFMSDLILKEGDSDYDGLIRKLFNVMTLRDHMLSFQIFREICDFILNYCGGHLYPTLKLVSYVAAELSVEHLQSLVVFQEYLFSAEFDNSVVFMGIQNRCFDHDAIAEASVDRIMRGVGVVGDTVVVDRLGWWNSVTYDFISTMLKNYCLKFISKTFAPKIALVCDEGHSFFSNTISMLTVGFSDMAADDFQCVHNIAVVPIENALSHSWSKRVLMKYSNVFMNAQITSPNSGYADFYVNGACHCIVEFIRNATQATCNEHLSRFLSGKYPWKNFIIVNFAMKGSKIVLPTNQRYRNIVFTYVHSENTLYCGNTAIKSPAVSSLKSAAPINNPFPISDFIEAKK